MGVVSLLSEEQQPNSALLETGGGAIANAIVSSQLVGELRRRMQEVTAALKAESDRGLRHERMLADAVPEARFEAGLSLKANATEIKLLSGKVQAALVHVQAQTYSKDQVNKLLGLRGNYHEPQDDQRLATLENLTRRLDERLAALEEKRRSSHHHHRSSYESEVASYMSRGSRHPRAPASQASSHRSRRGQHHHRRRTSSSSSRASVLAAGAPAAAPGRTTTTIPEEEVPAGDSSLCDARDEVPTPQPIKASPHDDAPKAAASAPSENPSNDDKEATNQQQFLPPPPLSDQAFEAQRGARSEDAEEEEEEEEAREDGVHDDDDDDDQDEEEQGDPDDGEARAGVEEDGESVGSDDPSAVSPTSESGGDESRTYTGSESYVTGRSGSSWSYQQQEMMAVQRRLDETVSRLESLESGASEARSERAKLNRQHASFAKYLKDLDKKLEQLAAQVVELVGSEARRLRSVETSLDELSARDEARDNEGRQFRDHVLRRQQQAHLRLDTLQHALDGGAGRRGGPRRSPGAHGGYGDDDDGANNGANSSEVRALAMALADQKRDFEAERETLNAELKRHQALYRDMVAEYSSLLSGAAGEQGESPHRRPLPRSFAHHLPTSRRAGSPTTATSPRSGGRLTGSTLLENLRLKEQDPFLRR